jgi:hypothetical protein
VPYLGALNITETGASPSHDDRDARKNSTLSDAISLLEGYIASAILSRRDTIRTSKSSNHIATIASKDRSCYYSVPDRPSSSFYIKLE